MKKALWMRSRRNSEPSIKIEKHSVIGASQTYDEHYKQLPLKRSKPIHPAHQHLGGSVRQPGIM